MTRRSKYDDDEPAAEKHAQRFIVTWWRSDDEGRLYVTTSEQPTAAMAGDVFRACDPESSPDMAMLTWDPARSRWDRHALDERPTPEERARMRARGIEATRRVLRHRRGMDSRGEDRVPGALVPGVKFGIEDSRGHDHRAGHECPICTRNQQEHESAGDCSTCDYLTQLGITPVHSAAPTNQPTPTQLGAF